MELDLLCIQTAHNLDVLNQIWTTQMQLRLKFREQFLPQSCANLCTLEQLQMKIVKKTKLGKPMKPNNMTITVWSINTMLMASLPLCLFTCHISVIRTTIFQVPFFVCNLDNMFSFRDITWNKWQYSGSWSIKKIYATQQYNMDNETLKQTILNTKNKQNTISVEQTNRINIDN